MPEMYFDVRWPDGVTERCYSPSTAARIEKTAAAYAGVDGAEVMVVSLTGAAGSGR